MCMADLDKDPIKTPAEIEQTLYKPVFDFSPRIPHYYGNYVRQFFLAVAIGILILAPFFGSYLPWTLPFEILGALGLAILAALTNPRNQLVMTANVAAAGFGLVAFELIALAAYFAEENFIFFVRETFAVLCLLALYYALKTLRAMVLGTIGKKHVTGEFLQNDIDEDELDARLRKHVTSATDQGD